MAGRNQARNMIVRKDRENSKNSQKTSTVLDLRKSAKLRNCTTRKSEKFSRNIKISHYLERDNQMKNCNLSKNLFFLENLIFFLAGIYITKFLTRLCHHEFAINHNFEGRKPIVILHHEFLPSLPWFCPTISDFFTLFQIEMQYILLPKFNLCGNTIRCA